MLRYLEVVIFTVWKKGLFVFIRIYMIYIMFFFGLLINVQAIYAQSTPVFIEKGFSASVPHAFDEERNTCNPEFWEVIKDRAWMEGQREITQNNNLIARPDSVLAMTCFDSFMDHLNNYANNEFPGDPGEAVGSGGHALTDVIIANDETRYSGGDDILSTQGYLMYAVLELLVLDQILDGVPTDTARDEMRTEDEAANPDLSDCSSINANFKQYYIDRNFPPNMVGDRSSVTHNMDNRVDFADYNGCVLMNDIWNIAKCYNFATETSHDAFYSLEEYRDNAISGDDYRTKEDMCDAPPYDNTVVAPSDEQIDCNIAEHGTPNLMGYSSVQDMLANLFPVKPLQTWEGAFLGADPNPGLPGGVDEYEHFLELRDSSDCSSITPIKIGYIVNDPGGNTYIDAVCPAPGCYFDPPSSLGGTGSCN